MVPEPPTPSLSVLSTANDVRAALLELSDDSKAAQAARYLHAVPGDDGEGDRFTVHPYRAHASLRGALFSTTVS